LQLRFFGSRELDTDPSNAFKRDRVLFIHIVAPHSLQFVKVEMTTAGFDTQKNITTCLEHARLQEQDQPAGVAGDGTGIAHVVGGGTQ
jgi:hypothetical protein